MKDKKIIYILLIIAILVVGIIVIVNIRNNTKNEGNTQTGIQYNEETGEYYILDEATNEIKASSTDESGLQIYVDNPDYNPNPLLEDTNAGSTTDEAEEYTGVYDKATGKYVNELTGVEIQ